MNKLGSNLFYSLSSHALKIVLPLLLFPFIARVIGSEGLGEFAYYQAITVIISSIVEFGFSYTIVNQIISDLDNKQKYIQDVELSRSVIAVSILFTFSCFAWYQHDIKIIISTITGILSGIIPIYLFQVTENFKRLTILELSALIIYYILSFSLLYFFKRVDVVLLSLMISRVFVYYFSKRLLEVKLFYLNKVNIKIALIAIKSNFIFFIHRASIVIYSTLTIIIVKNFYSLNVLGYYSSAEKIVIALCGLCGPIQNVLLPYLSKKSIDKKINYISLFVVLLFISVCFILYSYSSEIFEVYYGNDMIEGSKYFNYLIWLFPLKLTTCFISTNLYLSQGKQRIFSNIYIKLTVFSIPLLILLSYYYGIFVMILTLLFVEAFFIILLIVSFLKKRELNALQ